MNVAPCNRMKLSVARSPSFVRTLVPALLAAACWSAPATADAEDRASGRDNDSSTTHIAVDFDVNAAVEAPEVDAGGGGALRIGRELDLFLVSLTPEIVGSYHSFSGEEKSKVYAGLLGGRLAIGKILEPAIFAHGGVARLDGSDARTGAILDGGVALDFTLLPLIDIGVHGAYNVILPRGDGEAFKFVTLGAQAALVL